MTSSVLGPAFTRESARVRELTPVQKAVRDQIVENDHPGDYEQSALCLCGAAGDDVPIADVDRHGLPARQVLCRACGLMRLSPRWREQRYRRFYESEYRQLYDPVLGSKEEFARNVAHGTARQIAAWVIAVHSRHRAPGPAVVVEVGAGAGWNLANLPPNWERIGYDVDRSYLEIGSRLFGISTKWGYLDEALADIGRADLVLLSHVVEHLLDPEEALRTVRSAMSEEALLLIEVPGIFRIHRSRLDVMAYMQNAHVYTFCAGTLRASCARVGFKILELDETVRAVCHVRTRQGAHAASNRDPRLWRVVLRYFRLCERGYSTFLHLRNIPVIGRYSGYAWKKLYFPLLALATPKAGARRLTLQRSGGQA
jgi:hypothetical protein